MSKYYIHYNKQKELCEEAQRNYTIVIGYDRPLNNFFMVIELPHSRKGTYLYNNLDDTALPYVNMLNLNYFVEAAEKLGFVIPEVVIQECSADASQAVGNKTGYFTNGQIKRLGA